MSQQQPPTPSEDIEKAKINLETAQIAWRDLERFFASGIVIYVAPTLPMVDVAYAIAQDNVTLVKSWMESRQLEHVSDAQAIQWHKDDTMVWSVVVKPWVLVQEIVHPSPAS